MGRKHSEEAKKKMSMAKIGHTPWNKDLKGVSKETSKKMSLKKVGKAPPNKGTDMTVKQRVKLSCVNRGIDIEKFDDFTTEVSKLERNKFADLDLHNQCFQRDNFTCSKCAVIGGSLNAHHLNSWKHFPEQRFELSNLITLCDPCHRQFHKLYGNGRIAPNIKEQYLEFQTLIF